MYINKFCLEIDTVNKLIYLYIAFVCDMTSSFLFTCSHGKALKKMYSFICILLYLWLIFLLHAWCSKINTFKSFCVLIFACTDSSMVSRNSHR